MDVFGDFVRGLDRTTNILKQQQSLSSSISDAGLSLAEITRVLRHWPRFETGKDAPDRPSPAKFPDYSSIFLFYAKLLETCDLQPTHEHLVELRRTTNASRKRYAELLRMKATVGPVEVLQEALKLKEHLANLHRAEVDFCCVLVNQWRAMLQSALASAHNV
jgi:hypothetical protein